MKQISYIPIGVIHSPFKKAKGSPIQSATAGEAKGRVEIFSNYTDGLKDLEGFSQVILLYHFHLSKMYSLTVRPFLDQNPRGLFATRAPARPNPKLPKINERRPLILCSSNYRHFSPLICRAPGRVG
jgi:tRNA-Thr(GGU) m(6)t(6)A37 methyltransferase TsaA